MNKIYCSIRHIGDSNEDDGLEEDSPEMIGPLPFENCEHPDYVCFLSVVCHGVHDCISYDVLHQLPAAKVLGPVTVTALGWDLNQHLDVLLGHAVHLIVNMIGELRCDRVLGAACHTLECRTDTSTDQSRN